MIGPERPKRRLAQLTHARADVRQNKARLRCHPGSILSRLSVAAGCIVARRCERRQRPVSRTYVLRGFLRLVSGARSRPLAPSLSISSSRTTAPTSATHGASYGDVVLGEVHVGRATER